MHCVEPGRTGAPGGIGKGLDNFPYPGLCHLGRALLVNCRGGKHLLPAQQARPALPPAMHKLGRNHAATGVHRVGQPAHAVQVAGTQQAEHLGRGPARWVHQHEAGYQQARAALGQALVNLHYAVGHKPVVLRGLLESGRADDTIFQAEPAKRYLVKQHLLLYLPLFTSLVIDIHYYNRLALLYAL